MKKEKTTRRTTRALPPNPVTSIVKFAQFAREKIRMAEPLPYPVLFDSLQQGEVARLLEEAKRVSRAEIGSLEEDARLGRNFRERQKEKASKARDRVGENGDFTLSGLIGTLAKNYGSATAKELWPHLFALLGKIGSDPIETGLTYSYLTAAGNRKRITLGTFKNKLAATKGKSR